MTKFLILALWHVLVGCAAPTQKDPNPMEALWAQIRTQIEDLETRGAPVDEWQEAAETSNPILTKEELRQHCGSHLQQSDIFAFGEAGRVFHFGLECNYHAVVFFEKQGRAV